MQDICALCSFVFEELIGWACAGVYCHIGQIMLHYCASSKKIKMLHYCPLITVWLIEVTNCNIAIMRMVVET